MELKDNIWNELDRIRGAIPIEKMIPAVIRITFVKFAADNYLFSETKEDMRIYANIHKSIANKDINAFVENSVPLFEMIDKKISANGILYEAAIRLENDLINPLYAKKGYSSETSHRLFDLLCALNLDEGTTDNSVISNHLERFIYECSVRSGKYGGEYYSSRSINALVKKLLNVGDSDTYHDFACGCGLSDMSITDGKGIIQNLSDANEEMVQLAIMLHIIWGYDMDKIHFAVSDVFEHVSDKEHYSKIFSDFPFGIKLNKSLKGYGDGTVYAIHKMIDELDVNGIAVITCPSSILSRTDRETTELRFELLTNKLLKSVITLPPVMIGTLVNVNLLILSKEKNESVLLVDASKNDVTQFSNNSKKASSELTQEGIDQICRIVKTNDEIHGISKVISAECLLKKNSISPQLYVEQVDLNELPSQQEIAGQLDDLYKALMESLKNR